MNPSSFPDSIECGRVVLRKHQLDLAAAMFNYVEKDRARLSQFLPWVNATKTVQDEVGYIQMTHAKWDQFELFDYGMFDRVSDIYMGNVGVHSIAWAHQRCELGYWILGDFEGQGFVADAVQGLEKTCFALGFNRIEIRCSSLNQRSASVPKRLGYCLEGVLVQHAIEMGRYRDTLIFAKIKTPTQQSERSAGSLHHLEIYVSDLKKSIAFWSWFLQGLGYTEYQNWDCGKSWKLGDTYLVLVQVDEKFKDVPYHRCRVGLNHLAFHAKSRAHVDDLTIELKKRGVKILYLDQHPQAGGSYAVYFEDPDRIKVEVVASA